jgi:hypothetical protein
MKTTATLAVLLALSAFSGLAPVSAQSIDRYAETLSVDADGNGHVVAAVTLPAGSPAILRLPVAVGRPILPDVRGSNGATAAVVTQDGRTWVTIEVPDPTGRPVALELTYDVQGVIDFTAPTLAHGLRRIRYEFVNTTGVTVADFEGTVMLPPGVIVASVDEVAPVPDDTEVEQPFTIGARDGRPVITIRGHALALGDRAGLTIRFTPRSSSTPLFVVLAILSAGYLYAFRDLSRPARAT